MVRLGLLEYSSAARKLHLVLLTYKFTKIKSLQIIYP